MCPPYYRYHETIALSNKKAPASRGRGKAVNNFKRVSDHYIYIPHIYERRGHCS